MGKLHELLSVEPDLRGQKDRIIGETKKGFQHDNKTSVGGMYTGNEKTYTPKQEDGVQYPAESSNVVTTVMERLSYTFEAYGKHMDAVLSKEQTNQTASDKITVGAEDIEVASTGLLAMERMLKEIRGVLEQAPTLDIAKQWKDSEAGDGIRQTDPSVKFRMEKLQDFKEVSPATEHHPAQIMPLTKDVIVGEWEEILFSGALRPKEKSAMIARCDELLRSVKKARQRANQETVVKTDIASKLFDQILNGK